MNIEVKLLNYVERPDVASGAVQVTLSLAILDGTTVVLFRRLHVMADASDPVGTLKANALPVLRATVASYLHTSRPASVPPELSVAGRDLEAALAPMVATT